MTLVTAYQLVNLLEETLKSVGVDYEAVIEGFGQVRASEEKQSGKVFLMSDHIRGLILSQLSNQRPWKPIADHLQEIDTIFYQYDVQKLLNADPDDLKNKILAIRCGNRMLTKQMRALKNNIKTLKRIETDFESLDTFVSSGKPDVIAGMIAAPGPYKLQQIGRALAFEYLKNVGVRAGKPDVHIRRVLSEDRLNYAPGLPSEQTAYEIINDLAKEAECNVTRLDNLLWMFCATNYGAVCGAKPRCHQCKAKDYCNYPLMNKIS